MKYIDEEELIAEIERLEHENCMNGGEHFCMRRAICLGKLRNIIYHEQQEQPEVDLKKEIKEWTNLMVWSSFPEQDGGFISEEDYRSVIRQTAIHFLSLNARKEE